MNELVKKWVEALRSGKYKQARNRLKKDDGYCCLGVLCVVAGIEPEKRRPFPVGDTYFFFENSEYSLPASVQAAANLDSPDAEFELNEDILNKYPEVGQAAGKGLVAGDYTNLANLNDSGLPFSMIATIIESQPRGMFKE